MPNGRLRARFDKYGAIINGRSHTEGVIVSADDAARVQQAFDAAIGGDVEPLVSLLAPELEWRGVERGHLWWRTAPS